ncbi:MAG TPA: response regulator, partial [Bryobacteraceae bacterium]|nr:response regulator [Bryobacteraceae bacterium]
MASIPTRQKQFLFVDDDTGFLNGIRQVFSELSQGSWNIFTAENHAQALAVLQKNKLDVVVLDLDMPVMDGLQFLRLLGRTHPGQQVVILTGRATEATRTACLEAGATLFLEKLITPDGFAAAFAALDALASAVPQEGFRGMMRRVGLQEVLQME